MRLLLANTTRTVVHAGFLASAGVTVLGCSGEAPASSMVSCGAGTELVNGECVPAAGSGGSAGNSGSAHDASAGGSAGTATGGSAGTATGGSAGTATGGSAGTATGGSAGNGGSADASTDTSVAGSAGQGGVVEPDASAGAGGSSGASGGAGNAGKAGDGGTEPDAAPADAAPPDASYPVCPMAAVDITDAIDVAGYYDSFTSGQGTLFGSCGGDGSGEAVLRYVAKEGSIVSIQLTSQVGQSHLDGVLYVRTQCDDPDSEVACNPYATAHSDATVAKVPAGPFYIFVDGWGSVGKYRLTMTKTPACSVDADCAGNPKGPVCNEATGLCVGCVTAFDCPANAPACESTDYYGLGPRSCMDLTNCAKDVIETGIGSDDGPAVARLLVPGSDGKASAQSLSCYVYPGFAPIRDSDWFKFQVADATDATVQLDYPMPSYPGRLRVYDEQGRLMGESAKAASPDVINLKLLPAGTYYVEAYLISDDKTFAVSLSVAPGQPCSTDQDCLSFDPTHAIMRPRCDATTHACEILEGVSLATGQVCDSHDDCQSGRCTYIPFSSSPATRAFCSTKCASDLECPFGQVCSDSEKIKMCMKPCGLSQECGPATGVTPSGSADWQYRTCNSSTGVCAQ